MPYLLLPLYSLHTKNGRNDINLKIGLAEWGFRDYPLEEHFKLSYDLGASYLEIGCGNESDIHRLPKNPSINQIIELNRLIQKYGINPSFGAIDGGYSIEDQSQLEQLINNQKVKLKALSQLGVRVVRIFSSWTPLDEMNELKWNNMLSALNELDEFAAKKGMKLAIETHGNVQHYGVGQIHLPNITTDYLSLERLINKLPPNTGILFDPGNLRIVVERPLKDYVDLLNDHIISCHIKDWKQNSDGSWTAVAIGDTDYDWAPIFKRMKYDDVGLIEYEITSDVIEGMQKSINYLKSIGFEM